MKERKQRMGTALVSAFEFGILYALMALGVYLSFRILDFPDLTVDGSFVTGGALAASMIVSGVHPIYATLSAIVAGFIAGCFTGILHAKGKINPLLSGILMMIALYSINLRIMGMTLDAGSTAGRSNIPLMREETIFTMFSDFWSKLGIDTSVNNFLTSMGVEFLP